MIKDYLDEKLHEECGVFGVYRRDADLDVVGTTYYGLYALQHRGQESCGMAVNDDGVFYKRRELGLVNDVFTKDVLETMPRGNMCIGHCRYATTGVPVRSNAQPFVIRHIKGPMALAHNGNLTNSAELRSEFELSGAIFHSTSDTEVIAYAITRERLSSDSIEQAVEQTMDRLKGAYSLVVMSPRKLIAARDPQGFRPLCIGKLGENDIIASESCAITAAGGEFVRDVEPGEIVTIDRQGIRSRDYSMYKRHEMCSMEYIYFARPDSDIDGCNVHAYRKESGRLLWKEAPAEADIVVGVPDSSLSAAMGYAEASGLPYEMGLIKNKYIGRTFIQPTQELREKGVRMKLSAVRSIVRGKRVVLVDDSIVRGTTSARTIRLLREAGAKEVHYRISAPPFAHPCYFGTDIPDEKDLIATGHTVEEINEMVGSDSLGYLSIEHVQQLGIHSSCGYCTGCFTGKYPVNPPTETMEIIYDKPLSVSNPNKKL